MNRHFRLGIFVAAVVLATGLAPVSSAHAEAKSVMSHMIACTPVIEKPYRSGYLILTVTVLANVTCVMELDDGSIVFAPVDLLDMDVHLSKFGPPGAGTSSEHFHAPHASHIRGYAVRFCNEGWYQGWITLNVTFPPGFNPRTLSGNFEGGAVYLTCGD